MISGNSNLVRAASSDVNPAGREFSEEDYKNGTVRIHVDGLHALTLEQSEISEESTTACRDRQPLALSAIDSVPTDLLRQHILRFLTHWDLRAADCTNTRWRASVSLDRSFVQIRLALSTGHLRRFRCQHDLMRRYEQEAVELFRNLNKVLPASSGKYSRSDNEDEFLYYDTCRSDIEKRLIVQMSNLEGGIWDELSQLQREMHLEHDAQLIIKCGEFIANRFAGDDLANDPEEVQSICIELSLRTQVSPVSDLRFFPTQALSAPSGGLDYFELRRQVRAVVLLSVVNELPVPLRH